VSKIQFGSQNIVTSPTNQQQQQQQQQQQHRSKYKAATKKTK